MKNHQDEPDAAQNQPLLRRSREPEMNGPSAIEDQCAKADQERRHSNQYAKRLRAGQKQNSRRQNLADDKKFREAPPETGPCCQASLCLSDGSRCEMLYGGQRVGPRLPKNRLMGVHWVLQIK